MILFFNLLKLNKHFNKDIDELDIYIYYYYAGVIYTALKVNNLFKNIRIIIFLLEFIF